MEKKYFIKKIQKIKFVAHRLGYQMTDYPENSLKVVETIFSNKKMLAACSGFEFDICFTKDHIPIVIHDKYIDDISDSFGFVKSYTLKELKSFNFGFRKSLNIEKKHIFKIVTLEEILTFFSTHKKELEDKIIKVETKDFVIFNKHNLQVLADVFAKFPSLTNNLIHLSFYPQNLTILKKIQKKKGYLFTKNDLLCDYKIIVTLSKFIKNLDNISLRIKTYEFPSVSDNNSKRVNKKITFDTFSMKFSNALNEKTLTYAIKRFNSVNIYTLNDLTDLEEFSNKVSKEFFENNYQNLVFTTNNPLYFKMEIRDDK